MRTLEYVITEENKYTLCDEIAEEIENFCSKYIKDRKNILKYRLTAEECLLNWIHGTGAESADKPEYSCIGRKLTFNCDKKVLRKPYFEICYEGDVFNPYMIDTNMGDFGQSVLRTLGVAPIFGYFAGINSIKFDIRENGQSTLNQLLVVIVASLLVGYLGMVLLPANVIAAAQSNFITPIYNKFFDILNCIAGPMIFLSVAWGVYGIGDASTLSKIGKKMLGGFIWNDFMMATLGVIYVPIFGLTLLDTNSSNTKLGAIFEMLLDFFPRNICQPFIDGNTLQIIFLAVAVGIAMLYLGKRIEGVAAAIEQMNYLVQFFMEFIAKIVPAFIFIVVVSLLWSDSFEILQSSLKFLVALLCGIFLTCAGFLIYTSIRQKVSIMVLFRKCIPSFMIAIATASSAATFNTNMDACDNKLGINHSVSSFGVPLAMVLSNPIAAINNIAAAIFFAEYFNIECSLTWVITAVLISAIVAIASPPIPGGGALAYTMLFTQLGIPEEALAIALAIDMLTDFFITSGEMFCMLPTLVNLSAKIGYLDKDMLRAE